ncbi:LysR family transcriptional regulator [Aureibacillus halotolerans]|nr:LysR family transcriptional regulator [Aureibacillus halotolerans]
MALEPIRTFIAVADEKSFTKAAQKLLLSQPSVSLHIKQLEEEFQTTLIDRSQKFVKLTATGEFFYQRAQELVALYDQTIQEIDGLHQRVEGTLAIGASYTIGEYLLPSLLAPFQQAFPGVELRVFIENTSSIAEKVHDRTLTLGFVEGKVTLPQLHVTPILEDEMVLVAPASYSHQLTAPVSPKQLAEWPWVSREPGSGTREVMNRFFDTHKLHSKRVTTISSNYGVKEAVVNGLGVSILSKWVVSKSLKQKELYIVPMIGWPALKRDFCLVEATTERTNAADTFIRYLLEHYSGDK